MVQFFDDRGPCQMETSPVICRASQWTGFYIIGTSVVRELIQKKFDFEFRVNILNVNFLKNILFAS